MKLQTIISVEEFLEYQEGLRDTFDDKQIKDGINLATNDINAFTNLLLEQVYVFNTQDPRPTDKTNPLYRSDMEMTALFQSVISQTYFRLVNGNDSSIGDASYSGAGVSISQSFSERNIIGPDVFQWLINARLMNMNKNEKNKSCDVDDTFFKNPIIELGERPYPDPIYVPSKFDNYIPGKILKIDQSGYVIQADQKFEIDVFFKEIKGNPTDNTNLKNELDKKINYLSKSETGFGVGKDNSYLQFNLIQDGRLDAFVDDENNKSNGISITNESIKLIKKDLDAGEILTNKDIVNLETKVDTNTTNIDVNTVNIAKLETDKANKVDVVNLVGDQTISGVKLFSAHVRIPNGAIGEDDAVILSQLKKVTEYLDDKQQQIIVAKGIETSEQYGKGDIIVDRDADFGNPALYIKTTPIRSGQIVLSNRYNGTDPSVSGNRFYANIYDNIPELNDQTKEVRFELNNTQAFPLIVNNNTDQNGYRINYDNIDTTLVISRGNSAAYAEGRITNQFTGNYTKNSQPYNWYNISLNCQVVNTAVGQDYIEFYGSGIGRDRNVFAILPNDKGPSNLPPESKPYNYFVYKKVV